MQKQFLSIDMSEIVCQHTDLRHQFDDTSLNNYLQNKFNDISRSLRLQSYDTLILSIVYETGDSVYWEDGLQKFLVQLKKNFTIEIVLIFDDWFKPFGLEFDCVDEIFYFNFLIYKIYITLIVEKFTEPVADWDYKEKNVLFMTGKTNKIQRTRLLYKLLNSKIKHCLTWSYFPEIQDIVESMRFLEDISSEEQKRFLSIACKKLDNNYGTFAGLTGIKFDPLIYAKSLFQIISETDFDRPLSFPFITEKVWLSIVNKRPFIVAGELFYLKKLQQLGIRTFDQYLPIPNYDDPDSEKFLEYSQESGRTGKFFNQQEIKNWQDFYRSYRDPSWPEDIKYDEIYLLPKQIQQEVMANYLPGIQSWGEIRLDAIVENAVFFKQNMSKFAVEVQKDIEHNFKRFLELGKYNQNKLENLCLRKNLRCKNSYDVFEWFTNGIK